MRWAGVPVMSFPSKRMRPELGGNVPVSRLKSVVLPAPFGPMIECRLPASMLSVTSLTAVSAPKDLVRFSVWRIAMPQTAHASTTPPRKKSTTITNATPSSSGQRAHTTLIDSESQMNTNEPMIGP